MALRFELSPDIITSGLGTWCAWVEKKRRHKFEDNVTLDFKSIG
jgi:hypothetical protein